MNPLRAFGTKQRDGPFGQVAIGSLLGRCFPVGCLDLVPLPFDQGGRGASFPHRQVPVIYLKTVANIWHRCLRRRSNRRPAAQSPSEHLRFNDNKLLASPQRQIRLTDVCLVLAIGSRYSFGDYAQLETITIKEV